MWENSYNEKSRISSSETTFVNLTKSSDISYIKYTEHQNRDKNECRVWIIRAYVYKPRSVLTTYTLNILAIYIIRDTGNELLLLNVDKYVLRMFRNIHIRQHYTFIFLY